MTPFIGEQPDIIACREDGSAFLYVEVKAQSSAADDQAAGAALSLSHAPEEVRYLMLADRDWIRLFHRRSDGNLAMAARFPTARVLAAYDEEFGHKPIFHHYLRVLVEAWIRDLAYHWKSETPPEQDTFERLDLLKDLRNGSTQAAPEFE